MEATWRCAGCGDDVTAPAGEPCPLCGAPRPPPDDGGQFGDLRWRCRGCGADAAGIRCGSCGQPLDLLGALLRGMPGAPGGGDNLADMPSGPELDELLRGMAPPVAPPAQPAEVNRELLERFEAHPDALELVELSLRVDDRVTLPGVPGEFTPRPRGEVSGALVDAGTAHPALTADVNGAIAVLRRGECTFATKLLRAQEAGAVAAVVVQAPGGVWPYTMTDSRGEAAGALTIPAVMVREPLPAGAERATLSIAAADGTCPVCLVGFDEVGAACVRLRKCRHVFHAECLEQWIETGKTSCPVCRTSFASSGGARGGAGAAAAEGPEPEWFV